MKHLSLSGSGHQNVLLPLDETGCGPRGRNGKWRGEEAEEMLGRGASRTGMATLAKDTPWLPS